MNFGDKFSQAEVDNIFGEFEVDDDGFVESKAVIGLFVAVVARRRRKRRRRRRPRRRPQRLRQRQRTVAQRRRRRRRSPLSKYNTTSSQTNNQHITKKTPHEPLKKRVLYYLHLYHFCCHLKSRPVKRTVNYTHKKE